MPWRQLIARSVRRHLLIEDPTYWTRDLVRTANKFASRATQRRWTAASTRAVEREVFLAAFSVRKLIESPHLQKRTANKKVPVTEYPSAKISTANRGDFSRLADLYRGATKQLPIREVMNRLVHSVVFSPFVPLGVGLMGFYFCSDAKGDVAYIRNDTLASCYRDIAASVDRSRSRLTRTFS